jgi:hypothetical protein
VEDTWCILASPTIMSPNRNAFTSFKFAIKVHEKLAQIYI